MNNPFPLFDKVKGASKGAPNLMCRLNRNILMNIPFSLMRRGAKEDLNIPKMVNGKPVTRVTVSAGHGELPAILVDSDIALGLLALAQEREDRVLKFNSWMELTGSIFGKVPRHRKGESQSTRFYRINRSQGLKVLDRLQAVRVTDTDWYDAQAEGKERKGNQNDFGILSYDLDGKQGLMVTIDAEFWRLNALESGFWATIHVREYIEMRINRLDEEENDESDEETEVQLLNYQDLAIAKKAFLYLLGRGGNPPKKLKRQSIPLKRESLVSILAKLGLVDIRVSDESILRILRTLDAAIQDIGDRLGRNLVLVVTGWRNQNPLDRFVEVFEYRDVSDDEYLELLDADIHVIRETFVAQD